jgi:hypothetical protein
VYRQGEEPCISEKDMSAKGNDQGDREVKTKSEITAQRVDETNRLAIDLWTAF